MEESVLNSFNKKKSLNSSIRNSNINVNISDDPHSNTFAPLLNNDENININNENVSPDISNNNNNNNNIDDDDYVVKIVNVSRLFFNTAGQPVPAVNCVSLGVKKNSIFGFLGANGAGKTTLIKMITSLLPPSDGTIEIQGKDISKFNDSKLISARHTVSPREAFMD